MKEQENRVAVLEHRTRVKPELTEIQQMFNCLCDMKRRLDEWRCYHRTEPPHCYSRFIGIDSEEAAALRRILELMGDDQDELSKDVRELVTAVLAELPVKTAAEMTYIEPWQATWVTWCLAGVNAEAAGCVWRLGDKQTFPEEANDER